MTTIDPSRYRTASAIVERYRAGEDIEDLARDYQLGNDNSERWPTHRYIIELIIAASEVDRG